MCRKLRFIPEKMVVEVTTRTIQSRLLLRPSPELNDRILGVIGRAWSLCDVDIHALVVMGNHIHFLLSTPDAKQLSKFMCHVNRNISDEVGRLHEWKGTLWERRYRCIPLCDEKSQIRRLKYILSNGCSEGLVDSPLDWPGATSVHTMVHGVPLVGTWIDRTAMFWAGRAGQEVKDRDFATQYIIPLTPLPCWQHLSPRRQRERCAKLILDIECETAAHNIAHNCTAMGAERLMQSHPHKKPSKTKRSPAPFCFGSKGAQRAFTERYKVFECEYYRAAQARREDHSQAPFPLGSFPPPPPFVPLL